MAFFVEAALVVGLVAFFPCVPDVAGVWGNVFVAPFGLARECGFLVRCREDAPRFDVVFRFDFLAIGLSPDVRNLRCDDNGCRRARQTATATCPDSKPILRRLAMILEYSGMWPTGYRLATRNPCVR